MVRRLLSSCTGGYALAHAPGALATATVVAVYCRISIDKSGRREGVEAQERWGREYAAERWPGAVVRVFVDNNLSAARDDRRPGYEALRAAVRAGEITHVWTVEQSRLERRKAPWFELAAELIAAGIDEVHTRRDGLVRLDDIGSDVRAIVNARYVADLKKRIRDKSAELAREGRPSGAVVFGYRHGLDERGRKALHVVAGAGRRGPLGRRRDALRVVDDGRRGRADRARVHRGAQGKPAAHVGSCGASSRSPTIAGRRVHRGDDIGPGNWDADHATWTRGRPSARGWPGPAPSGVATAATTR